MPSTSKPVQLGIALRATVTAIRSIVTALHNGELPSMITSQLSKNVYWTPSFQQGRAPELPESKPYSALLISLLLGNATATYRAHDIVKLALLILELNEMGDLTEQDLEDIFNGSDGFTMRLLQTVLIKTKDAHYTEFAEHIIAFASTNDE